MLLRHTDNLSRTLQHGHVSAAEGQVVATMTMSTLASLRNDERFDLFWEKVTKMATERDVDEPKLPRQRKRPARYEQGRAPPEFHSTAKEFYRPIYYEGPDLIVQTIKDRFDQPGYRVYQCLENLLLKAAKLEDFSEELKLAVTTYGSDIHESNLQMQLQTLGCNVQERIVNIFDVRDYLQKLTPAERLLLNEVTTVMKLILVMPATNAVSERSFSAMRRVKTYLRSTMTQERLNNLMILHVHKEFTDALDLVQVANEFVRANESRLRSFGKF